MKRNKALLFLLSFITASTTGCSLLSRRSPIDPINPVEGKNFTITFDPESLYQEPFQISVNSGETITPPCDPVSEGKKFEYWSNKTTGEKLTNSYVANSDAIFIAKYSNYGYEIENCSSSDFISNYGNILSSWDGCHVLSISDVYVYQACGWVNNDGHFFFEVTVSDTNTYGNLLNMYLAYHAVFYYNNNYMLDYQEFDKEEPILKRGTKISIEAIYSSYGPAGRIFSLEETRDPYITATNGQSIELVQGSTQTNVISTNINSSLLCTSSTYENVAYFDPNDKAIHAVKNGWAEVTVYYKLNYSIRVTLHVYVAVDGNVVYDEPETIKNASIGLLLSDNNSWCNTYEITAYIKAFGYRGDMTSNSVQSGKIGLVITDGEDDLVIYKLYSSGRFIWNGLIRSYTSIASDSSGVFPDCLAIGDCIKVLLTKAMYYNISQSYGIFISRVSQSNADMPTSIAISGNTDIAINTYETFNAIVNPNGLQSQVNWSVSDTTIAKVNPLGHVYGLKTGDFTLTAEVKGLSSSVLCHVYENTSKIISVGLYSDAFMANFVSIGNRDYVYETNDFIFTVRNVNSIYQDYLRLYYGGSFEIELKNSSAKSISFSIPFGQGSACRFYGYQYGTNEIIPTRRANAFIFADVNYPITKLVCETDNYFHIAALNIKLNDF